MNIVLMAHSDGESHSATPRPVSNPREGKRLYIVMGTIKKEMFQEGLITQVSAVSLLTAGCKQINLLAQGIFLYAFKVLGKLYDKNNNKHIFEIIWRILG